jgi:outer membrane protein assembly factor BamA
MKRTKLILLVTFFVFCSGYNVLAIQKQKVLVEEVELRGYRNMTREALLSLIKTRAGQPYDAKQVERDFAQVIATERFDKKMSRVLAEDGPRGGKVVIFDLKELPPNR